MGKCTICKSDLEYFSEKEIGTFCECPHCGRYFLPNSSLTRFTNAFWEEYYDKEKLRQYLFYNKYIEERSFFIGTKEAYEHYLEVNPNSTSILLNPKMVEAWYPKTFAEKIDKILLYIAKKTTYMGEKIWLNVFEMSDMCFIEGGRR